jgi:hypothetical protein
MTGGITSFVATHKLDNNRMCMSVYKRSLTFAVMVMLRHMSANGRTLIFMMVMPWFSSSEMIITSTPLLSVQHIFSRTVSPWRLASMVGLDPLLATPEALRLVADASLSLDMLHFLSKMVGTYVLLTCCSSSRVFTFSSSCFTYLMVLSRIVILSV